MSDLAQGSAFQMTISMSLTSIAQVNSIGYASERPDIDITHLGSGVQGDFLPGVIDPGTVDISFWLDPDGATHQAITDQYILTTTVACKIVWSDTTELPVTAYVKSVNFGAEVNNALTGSASFKVSDAVVYAT